MSKIEINIYNNGQEVVNESSYLDVVDSNPTKKKGFSSKVAFGVFLACLFLIQKGVIRINEDGLSSLSSTLRDLPYRKNNPSTLKEEEDIITRVNPEANSIEPKPKTKETKETKETKSIEIPEYTVHAGHFLDKTPPGTYDLTLELNGVILGAPIPSPCNGRIIRKWFQGRDGGLRTGKGAGQIIELYCEDGVFKDKIVLMGHLIRNSGLSAGTTFKKGQTVGFQGSTGRSSGAHIHLQVHYVKNRKLGARITNRRITRPMVESYMSFMLGDEDRPVEIKDGKFVFK